MNLGEKIRGLRQALGLTQEELAERADLTKGFISQVENNVTSLSVESLLLILKALDVKPSVFFSDTQPQIVYRSRDFLEMYRDGVKSCKLMVSGSTNKEMEPIMVTLAAGEKTPDEIAHNGEEFGYVLKGSLQLRLGEKTYRVRAGQCFYYEAKNTHCLVNDGKAETKVVWVSAPPSF